MVKLYMLRASLAHHQEFRNCVCSQVSYSIILDSVFCSSRAASVQGSVGLALACDGCLLGGVGGLCVVASVTIYTVLM